jgi:5-methylthioadenosine/S-adenosylhomocysteine deaminase
MATIDGAKSLGLAEQIGSVEVGKRADLAIVNLRNHNTIPVHNSVSSLVYCATQENVDTVIVDGRILMQGRKVKSIDEESLLEKAERVGYALAERAGTLQFRERPWGASHSSQ